MGPPAESVWAVEPVGVARMSPSAAKRVMRSPSTRASNDSIRDAEPFLMTMSLSATADLPRLLTEASSIIRPRTVKPSTRLFSSTAAELVGADLREEAEAPEVHTEDRGLPARPRDRAHGDEERPVAPEREDEVRLGGDAAKRRGPDARPPGRPACDVVLHEGHRALPGAPVEDHRGGLRETLLAGVANDSHGLHHSEASCPRARDELARPRHGSFQVSPQRPRSLSRGRVRDELVREPHDPHGDALHTLRLEQLEHGARRTRRSRRSPRA